MNEIQSPPASRRTLSVALALAVGCGLILLVWLSLTRNPAANALFIHPTPFGPEPAQRMIRGSDFSLAEAVEKASPTIRVRWEEAAAALTDAWVGGAGETGSRAATNRDTYPRKAKKRDQALADLAEAVEPGSTQRTEANSSGSVPRSFAPLLYALVLAQAHDQQRGYVDSGWTASLRQGKGRAGLMARLEADKHPFAQYALGRSYEAQGKHAEARRRYEDALAAAPDFAFAWSRLGYAALALDEKAVARRAFRMAIGIFANDSARYRNTQVSPAEARNLPLLEAAPYGGLAQLYLAEQKTDTAALVLALGEERGSDDAELVLAHACWWEFKGHLAKARQGYDSLLSEYPDWDAARRLRASLGLKGSAEPAGREALFAIQTLSPLVKAYPNNAPLRLALAKAYAKRELHGLAVLQFDSAMALDPQLPEGENLRREAYERWMSQESRAGSDALNRAAEAAASSRASDPALEGQDRAVVPSSMALLGTYGVSWGASAFQVREAYPDKRFLPTAGGHLIDRYAFDGLLHENLLAFRNDSLYGVLAQVSDTSKLNIDVFGRMIRVKTKISGEGKGTGEASCAGYRSFQGAIWENDDTFEFMAQFQGKETQIRLGRVARWALPQDRRLCDMVRYLDRDFWELGPTTGGKAGKPRAPEAALRAQGKGSGKASALVIRPAESSQKSAKKREPIDIAPMPDESKLPPRPASGKTQAPGTGVPIITPASPDFDIDAEAGAFDGE